MKEKLYKIFLIAVAFVVWNKEAVTQDTTGTFPLGVFIGSYELKSDPRVYNSLDSLGINLVVQYADITTQPYLEGYKLLAYNAASSNDYINHYASGYYTRWQAEMSGDISKTGVMHKDGIVTTWKGKICWTNTSDSPSDSLMFGPHYKQDKYYKQMYLQTRIRYTARYRLALDYDSSYVDPEEEVCRLMATVRYTKLINGIWDDTVRTATLSTRTLTAADFQGTAKNFKDFDLIYEYPEYFTDRNLEHYSLIPVSNDTIYSEVDNDNGVEFKVQWLGGGPHKRNLYIDYVDVFDNEVWGEGFMRGEQQTNQTILSIISYAQNYSGWPNLEYWFACDEPRTIDNYTPYHIVDSLLRENSKPPLITEIYPTWNHVLNGDTTLRKFYLMAKPVKLMIDSYPVHPPEEETIAESFGRLREYLQLAHRIQKDFWYVGQGFGARDLEDSTKWHVWKKPDSTELKASVMLALSHGIKGLLFWQYISYPGYQPNCDCNVFYDCIIDTFFHPTELWNIIRNSFVPRLQNNLGNTLLKSGYTGNYAVMRRITPTEEITYQNPGYLSLTEVTPGTFSYNFHAGLLKDTLDSDNDYFLLVNLLTTADRSVRINLTKPNSAYINYRVRDIERRWKDYSFTTGTYNFIDTVISGEGHLYQLAPVIKY